MEETVEVRTLEEIVEVRTLEETVEGRTWKETVGIRTWKETLEVRTLESTNTFEVGTLEAVYDPEVVVNGPAKVLVKVLVLVMILESLKVLLFPMDLIDRNMIQKTCSPIPCLFGSQMALMLTCCPFLLVDSVQEAYLPLA